MKKSAVQLDHADPIQVSLHYFAILREERGLESEKIYTLGRTAGELYDKLRGVHGFTPDPSCLKVAVNDEIVSWERILDEGDNIVFLPPFSGG